MALASLPKLFSFSSGGPPLCLSPAPPPPPPQWSFTDILCHSPDTALFSVSLWFHSCPEALTACFGQCPSLFKVPSCFRNPGIAGNHWWLRNDEVTVSV